MNICNALGHPIANILESLQVVRDIVKRSYHRINYLWYSEPDFTHALHRKVTLIAPEVWAGVKALNGQLFFGYFDKSPWTFDMEKALFHQILCPDIAKIVVLDRKGRLVNIVGSSRAWNLQQGTMAQWLPATHGKKVIYNDLVGDRLGCRIVDSHSSRQVSLAWPVQALHPSGEKFLSLNYRRLARLRPDYGYFKRVDNFSENQALDQDGIWEVSIKSGKGELIVSLSQLKNNRSKHTMRGCQHKVNHLLYSPGGDHFVFMHRWIGSKGKWSRLYITDSTGGHLRILLDDRMVSHYCWKDQYHLLAWARTNECGDHYYLINVIDGSRTLVGDRVMDAFGDGHPSFSPNRQFIITDTYPDKARQRHLLMYNIASGELTQIGRFFAPWRFDGMDRCDLHPRWSPDGNMISIDSSHLGVRRSYFIDVSRIVAP